jgi:hypothetical protein
MKIRCTRRFYNSAKRNKHYSFIETTINNIKKKSNVHYANDVYNKYDIKLNDPYFCNIFCNNLFNCYMEYYYDKKHYMNYNVTIFDSRSTIFKLMPLIHDIGYPRSHGKKFTMYSHHNMICIHDRKYHIFSQIASDTNVSLSFIFIKLINHHKMKRMMIIIKLLLNIVSKYIIKTVDWRGDTILILNHNQR